MGSSFHWADAPRAREEFRRILKPEGFFTAIWNPRDIQRSKLHMQIEETIMEEIPGMKRVSSGSIITTDIMLEKLGSTFKDLVFMEAGHEEIMSKECYINIWRSVNDIQVQAGEEGFRRIMYNIENILKDYKEIIVPYKNRAWTARVCDIIDRKSVV